MMTALTKILASTALTIGIGTQAGAAIQNIQPLVCNGEIRQFVLGGVGYGPEVMRSGAQVKVLVWNKDLSDIVKATSRATLTLIDAKVISSQPSKIYEYEHLHILDVTTDQVEKRSYRIDFVKSEVIEVTPSNRLTYKIKCAVSTGDGG